MGALIDHIAHPPEVLASSNAQHRELLAAVRAQDLERATRVVTEHLEGDGPRPGRPAALGGPGSGV